MNTPNYLRPWYIAALDYHGRKQKGQKLANRDQVARMAPRKFSTTVRNDTSNLNPVTIAHKNPKIYLSACMSSIIYSAALYSRLHRSI